jgi:UDP-glucose 4-epimerase
VSRRVVVTGAAGFIGSAICRCFSREPAEVIAVIRPGQQSPPGAVRQHQIALPDRALARVLADERPDVVVHCAGGASVGQSLDDPAGDFVRNVVVTQQLYESVIESGVRPRVVLISSAAVYGNPLALPVSETAATNPISPYGFHKLMAEQVCRQHARLSAIPSLAVRVFSAYGPGQRKQLLWDVFTQARRDRVVRLDGTGEETRDFIHVDDVAAAIERLLVVHPFDGDVVNVATGEAVTVAAVSRLLLAGLSGGHTIEFSGRVRPGDPRHWRADVSRLRAAGFTAGTSLEAGVAGYGDWLRSLS